MHRFGANSGILCSSCGRELGYARKDVIVIGFIYCNECRHKRNLHPRHAFTCTWDGGIFSTPFIDCCLQGSDGGNIRAHKAVLAGKSKVFKAMFPASMSEYPHEKVQIADMTAQELRPLVNFLYTGAVSKKSLEIHAVALFKASKKYEIPLLKPICEHFLRYNVFGDVHGVFEIAKRYNSETLQQAVLPYLFHEEFLRNNSAAVVVKAYREASTFEGYKEYRRMHPRKIAYFMETSVYQIADYIMLGKSEEVEPRNHKVTVGSFEEWDEWQTDAPFAD